MPKKINVQAKKDTPPGKKPARRKKPVRKKRPADKKSRAARTTLVETFELDVVNGEGPERVHEEVDDDFPHDIGGSE
jgi:hypothetical protein